jgi:hypothetical protein
MRALIRVIEGLTSWWRPPRVAIHHPDGKFDKSVLIDAVQEAERQMLMPTHIVMTSDQHDDYLRHERWLAWNVVGGHSPEMFGKFMGCKVEIDDVPTGCVGIEGEW